MNILLTGIVGSRAYGLEHPGSDTDRMSIFQLPSVEFLGLSAPDLTHVRQGGEADDWAMHEVGKFVNLALANNPTVSELLWLPEDLYEVRSAQIEPLFDMAASFWFAQGVRNAYLGYAQSQVARAKRKFATPGRCEKAARHVWRLLHQGATLWRTGKLEVRVWDRDACLAFGQTVAHGDVAQLDKLWDWAQGQFALPTVLPDDNAAARAHADTWLRQLRLSDLS